VARPVLYVLAGVNGAGKSSVGGHLLEQAGLAWFNPDTFARELVVATGCDQVEANALAWQEGLRRLDQALAQGTHYAFETTLGGRTIPARIKAASETHDVLMWFCGLASPEQHMARVRARVAAGGHDIPEAKIRERYTSALANLIALMPCLAHLQVYDNSVDVVPGEAVPDPQLVAEMEHGRLVCPMSIEDLHRTPEWAKPLVEAMLVAKRRACVPAR
jgi:predicted ABC-type ATPase